jgi:para-nitrobenzyl esterase
MTSAPTFTPACGPVEGRRDGAVTRATGIPYATATRFEVPVAAADWTTPFVATGWSAPCPQKPVPFLDEVLGAVRYDVQPDENCLRLSVTMPSNMREGEVLPVMVWIHGGSYTSGAGDMPIMDPAALVAEQQVIVVTVTYRLGLFGYLGGGGARLDASAAGDGEGADADAGAGAGAGAGSDASAAGADTGAGGSGRAGDSWPANLGLLDQWRAFEWVQRNISAFGGNPSQVTAFGQSAGGDAVAHLMAIPGATQLFRRAIIQSAPLGISRGRAAMNAALREEAGSVAAARVLSAAELVALQARVEAAASGFGLAAAMPLGTQYGEAPLPAEADVGAAWEAVAPEIDVLIGHTSEEAGLFVPRLPSTEKLVAMPVIGRGLSKVLVSVLTRAVYGKASRAFAKRHARAGGNAHHFVLSWSAKGSPWGAAHTIDLPLLFGDEKAWSAATLLTGATWAEVQDAAKPVRQLWADFARGAAPQSIPGVLACARVSG